MSEIRNKDWNRKRVRAGRTSLPDGSKSLKYIHAAVSKYEDLDEKELRKTICTILK